jgi:hypothetical protein
MWQGVFPPNTLFRLKEILDASTWEAPPKGSDIYPRQRLLVCSATYRPPRTGAADADGNSPAKLVGTVQMLAYGDRRAYVKGLDDIFAKPVLTMENEFDRDFVWSDWKGASYSLKEEWEYVTGPAQRKDDCTPGSRDSNNDGKSPEEFLTAVNDVIVKRRKEGHGTRLPINFALLTLEEVLSVRLYSGPAFGPINEFLRQVSNLTGRFRKQVIEHPGLTFAATVGNIYKAIRKLAAIATPEEASAPLYRGVRGELPEHFWLPDAKGMVCAVDMAFMSTSGNRETPIRYMGNGQNVLWELKAEAETDVAYHRGADISMLSQFSHEKEVLFPPGTMLVVHSRVSAGTSSTTQNSADAIKYMRSSLAADESSEGGKSFVHISVTPYFL